MSAHQTTAWRSPAAWRTAIGTSAVLWAGGGRHVVEPDWWMALSGVPSVDYNLVLCHEGDVASRIAQSIDEVAASGAPALIMAAGRALGAVQRLVDAGWACVGTVPLMAHELPGGVDDHAVRRLGADEWGVARRLVGRAFHLAPELTEVALPHRVASDRRVAVWGLGGDELASCVATVTVDRTMVLWSMATPPERQRRGDGGRLVSALMARAGAAGCDAVIMYASATGEPFYESLGYEVVERWQLWSRPRWVLGQ